MACQLRSTAEHGWTPLTLKVSYTEMFPHVLRYVGAHPERVSADVTNEGPLPRVFCPLVVLKLQRVHRSIGTLAASQPLPPPMDPLLVVAHVTRGHELLATFLTGIL